MGRGVAVNKFGTFSFSAPDVVLDGVTNPVERDKQPRQPVFLVAKVSISKTLGIRERLQSQDSHRYRPTIAPLQGADLRQDPARHRELGRNRSLCSAKQRLS